MNSKTFFVLQEKRVSYSHRTEVMRTGRIPLGDTSGRPVIPPGKQVLAFLWSMGNQEPARAVADRFNITMSSVNRILVRLSQAPVDLSGHYIKWPDGDHE